MAIQIDYAKTPFDAATLSQQRHVLVLLEKSCIDLSSLDALDHLGYADTLKRKLQRLAKPLDSLLKSPLQTESATGCLISWVVIDPQATTFQTHSLLRKAIQPLLDEQAQEIALVINAEQTVVECMSMAAFYVAGVNAAVLPSRKSKAEAEKVLEKITLYPTAQSDKDWQQALAKPVKWTQAVIEGNTLCRQLTILPPNELTPQHYRQRVKQMAQQHGWEWQEFDMQALRAMKAGAFVAVGQGSDPEDAAIVHVRYRPSSAQKTIALIGKGICFDTGGHNLKPAKYMHGMHEDMNGSAVALGTLLAATQAQLPINLDVWLAIAQNHISPLAYKQNDVVTALNGTTIEIMHTDAEGRMVLADTLTLASRNQPDWMIDFATLTGSMVSALAERYSGVLSNRPELVARAVSVGAAVGERLCAFPFDEDYDEELESKLADIKQCTLDGGADHIHAARFLSKFIEQEVAWVHVDLSSYNHKGGLGAVSSDVNGFGVALSMELLRRELATS